MTKKGSLKRTRFWSKSSLPVSIRQISSKVVPDFASASQATTTRGPSLDSPREWTKNFSVGDIFCGFGAPMLHKPPQDGAHQDYHVARHSVHKIPSNVKLETAWTIPVVVQTAADGLFNQLGLKLGSKEQNPILIWEGSCAVGAAAIMLAKTAGCSPIMRRPRTTKAYFPLGQKSASITGPRPLSCRSAPP